MPTYRPGDVVIVDLPFTSGAESKARPVVVLFDTGDQDIVVIPATTQPVRSVYDIELVDWRKSGFDKACCVRVSKPQTVEKKFITRKPGSLSQGDWAKIQAGLRKLLPL